VIEGTKPALWMKTIFLSYIKEELLKGGEEMKAIQEEY